MNAGRALNLVLTTPTDREIVLTRAFQAERASVFRAFTEPKLIERWLLGPDGWSMPLCQVDLRPGGKFHYRWRNDESGMEFGLLGTYREIEAPARIVHREDFDEVGNEGDATVTTTFVERDGVTTMTMTIEFDSRELRDKAIESGMVAGTDMSFNRLADVVLVA